MLVPLPHPRPPVPAPATPGPGTRSTRSGWARSYAPPFPRMGGPGAPRSLIRGRLRAGLLAGSVFPGDQFHSCQGPDQTPLPSWCRQGWREPSAWAWARLEGAAAQIHGRSRQQLPGACVDGRADRPTSGWLEAVPGGGEGWLKPEASGGWLRGPSLIQRPRLAQLAAPGSQPAQGSPAPPLGGGPGLVSPGPHHTAPLRLLPSCLGH